jgi:hypothetical protein
MRLVVITRFVNHIEDRSALLQETGGAPGALNLMNGPAGQPGYLENASLFGPRRDILQLTANRSFHGAIGHNQTSPHEPFHERLRVLEAGKTHADPFSQNERLVAFGNVTSFRSRRAPERTGALNVPSLKSTPNHSPCGGQSAIVALVSGPRTVSDTRPSRRVTTTPQWHEAME